MDKIIKFSIVIPTFNRAGLLKQCIDSIIAQTYQVWEAIIVDNYSTDNTEQLVKSYNDERIIYIKNHNYGIISISRNKAIDMSTGTWICFLDSDDSWLPNKLEELHRYVNKYDLVYHGYQSKQKQFILQRTKNYFYRIKENTVNYVIQRGNPLCPSCVGLSRDLLGDTRFDESKDLKAVEDYDFFLQILAKKPRIKYVKKALTKYDMNGCSHSEDVIENDYKILNKWKGIITEEEMSEALLIVENRRAWYYRSIKDYSKARNHFRNVMNSKIPQKKKNAFIEYLKTYILQLLKM